MAWTEVEFDTEVKSDPTVFPYEDWERRTRPNLAEAVSNGELWQAVIIALTQDEPVTDPPQYIAAADAVIGMLRSGQAIASEDARRNLTILSEPHNYQDFAADAEILSHIVIYRKETEARTEPEFGIPPRRVYDTVHISSAVPRAILHSRPPSPPLVGLTKHSVNNDAVLTAVIDDAMGIANQRFRKSETETRIVHFWNQGLEFFYGFPGSPPNVLIGEEFNESQINGVLTATTSETEFYSKLYGIGRSALVIAAIDAILEAINGYPENELPEEEFEALLIAFFAAIGVEIDPGEIENALNSFFAIFGLPRGVSRGGQALGDYLLTRKEEIVILSNALKYLFREYERPLSRLSAHGTAVMDIAAGFDLDSHDNDERPIVAVELPSLATLETSGARLEAYVLQAVQRILHWADNYLIDSTPYRVPVVINFSYGITAGPKNGKGVLEREIERLVNHRNKEVQTIAVLPSGNSYRSALNGDAQIEDEQEVSVDWQVLPEDFTPSFLEMRVDEDAAWTLTIKSPGGDVFSQPKDAFTGKFWVYEEDAIYRKAVYVKPEGETGKTLITIALAPTSNWEPPLYRTEPGTYLVTLKNQAGKEINVRYDVQRDDTPVAYPTMGRQSYLDDKFLEKADPVTKARRFPFEESVINEKETLNAVAGTQDGMMFLVGGTFPDNNRLDVKDPDRREPTRYTSEGSDPRKPDLSAISEQGRSLISGVLASGTFSGSVVAISGTSAAVPQFTRAVVDHLLSTTIPALPFDKDDILKALFPPAGPVPVLQNDVRKGVGTLDAEVAVARAGRLPRRRAS